MNINKIAKYLNMTEEQANDVYNLFNKLVAENNNLLRGRKLETEDDYIKCWEDNWYRAMSFEELVQSEVEQGGWDGEQFTWHDQAKQFCTRELNNTIFKLPCGMYVQYV